QQVVGVVPGQRDRIDEVRPELYGCPDGRVLERIGRLAWPGLAVVDGRELGLAVVDGRELDLGTRVGVHDDGDPDAVRGDAQAEDLAARGKVVGDRRMVAVVVAG